MLWLLKHVDLRTAKFAGGSLSAQQMFWPSYPSTHHGKTHNIDIATCKCLAKIFC